MGRIRQMSPNEVEKVLKRYGFEKISQKGSHRKWRNVDQSSNSKFQTTDTQNP